MSCTKNPKKFLGLISYKGWHEWEIIRFHPFMQYVRDNYIVVKRCKNCQAETEDRFLTEMDLLNMGLTIEQIRKGSLR